MGDGPAVCGSPAITDRRSSGSADAGSARALF